MSNKILDRIGHYYNDLVSTYGHHPRSCDYGQQESQKIKFTVLGTCTDYTNKSVLDIGCGFADFYSYLVQKYGSVDYHGVDISTKMIETAKTLHPSLHLEVRNVFEDVPDRKFDIITANGIFYLLGNEAWPLLQVFVKKMYDMCNEVVAFNTLSVWAPDKQDGEFYADPSVVLSFCKSLSPWVSLRHDYHTRDFSVFIYKSRNV